jgi:integrase/recombinase XerD
MKLIQSKNYVFHKADGTKLSEAYVSKLFKKYVKKAGLDDRFHFHCLRHTALTHLGNNGISAFMLKQIAGHSDIKTTQIYVRPSHDEIRRALDEIRYPWME